MARLRSASRFWLLILIPAVFVITSSAAAQTTGGVISGTIVDAQSGVLPGVAVTVTNVDSGVVRSVVTETDGRYRIPALPPGRYTLRAELGGFGPVEITGLTVTIGLDISSNLTMQLVGVNESITVTAQAPVVETTKSDVSGVITQQQIESIPLATRQPVALALLMPGTSQDAVRPRKFNANVGAGAFTNAGAFLVDGVWNKEPCTGEPRQNYPTSAIQEFKVNVSQATAEYGWTASGVVAMATKSGTNRYSGEAFEYFRDQGLSRLNKFESLARAAGAPKPKYRRNQYGAALGGPLIKDRLHFFAAAERTKEDKYIVVNTGRPQFYSSLEGTFPIPEYDNTAFLRGDYQINSKQNAFLRLALERADYTCDLCGGTASAFSNDGINQPRYNLTGGHTWILSSRMLNDVRFQWSYYGFFPHPPGVTPTARAYEYPAERTKPLTQVFNFPSMTWGTNSNLYVLQYAREIRDDFSISTRGWGTHTWKFGGAITNLPDDDDVPPALGTWTFASDQLFDPSNPAIMANLRNPITFTAAAPVIRRHLPNTYNEIYVQDEWRPASRLTLNLGLRYDIQTQIWNDTLDINDKTKFPTTGTPTQIPFVDFKRRGDKNNLGPRAGVAYDLRGDSRSVVRAGWGIYFNPIFATVMRGEQTNFRQAAISISNPTYPDPYGGRDPLTFASTAAQNISIVDNDLENPRARATTVGFSQALTPTIGLHVDGVFNRITGVPLLTNINPRSGGATGNRAMPQFARVDQLQSLAFANYKALLMRLEKQYDRRYQFLLSYTLAKGDGNVTFTGPSGRVTQSERPDLDIGPAGADRRHVVVASGSVLLPWDLQFGGVWTYRSTMPFSALAGRDLNGDAQVTDYVPGTSRGQGNRNLDLSLVNTWRASNGLAAIPASQIDTNDYNALDVRVTKSLPLGGGRKLDLIAQVFNVFGTNNLLASGGGAGGWVTNALSDSFGRILTALNRQQAELAVRVAW